MKILANTTNFEGKPYSIIELENLKELGHVYADNNNVYYYKDLQFTIKRKGCNVYGNPLYKITLSKNFKQCIELLKGKIYRTYANKCYGLITSYNLEDTLNRILSDIA